MNTAANIHTELTQEQTRLVIAALNAEIIKGAGTFLSDTDVNQLGTVMNNLKIRLSFAQDIDQAFSTIECL